MAPPPLPPVSHHILIGTHWFLVLPNVIANIKPAQLAEVESNGDYIAATVVSTASGGKISKAGLEEMIQDFEARDDVWFRSFLSGRLLA